MGKPVAVQPGRRRGRHRALHRLVRRGGRQDLRRDRADAGQRAGADHPRGDGRDRCGGALELPDDHGRLEARAGAGRGQQRGAQAQREEPADGVAPGRTGGRGRPARRRVQRRAGLRPRSRRGAGAAHGRRCDRLHRQHARGPQDARVRRAAATSSASTTSWAASRPSWCSPTSRTSRAPPRRWPAACSSTRARAATRRRACSCTRAVADEFLAIVAAEAPKYQPGDPLSRPGRDGRAGRRDADAHRAGLHRRRPWRRRDAWSAGGKQVAQRDRRLLRRADGVRRRAATT